MFVADVEHKCNDSQSMSIRRTKCIIRSRSCEMKKCWQSILNRTATMTYRSVSGESNRFSINCDANRNGRTRRAVGIDPDWFNEHSAKQIDVPLDIMRSRMDETEIDWDRS